MFKRRLVLLFVVLVSVFLLEAPCPAHPDGYVVCNAICEYPNYCMSSAGGYCYFDAVVETCFDGDYDPCCH